MGQKEEKICLNWSLNKGGSHIQMVVPLKILKVALLLHCKCEIPWLLVPGEPSIIQGGLQIGGLKSIGSEHSALSLDSCSNILLLLVRTDKLVQ